MKFDKMKNPHGFLAEELLSPNVNKTSSGRNIMFVSNLSQAVVLDNGEPPRVFTRFENSFGGVSSAYKKTDSQLEVLSVIVKHTNRRLVIFQDKSTGIVSGVEVKKAYPISESFGYTINTDTIDELEPHDIVDEGTTLYHSTAFDEDLNFNFGTNIRTAMLAVEGMTYEDGIVISESATKKLVHNSVEQIDVTLNSNDVLINLYGNNEEYKCFPSVGEMIEDSKLCSRRRINYDLVLQNMTETSLREHQLDDTMFFGTGEIIDIEVFVNSDTGKLAADESSGQIYMEYRTNQMYHGRIKKRIEELKEMGYDLDDELMYIYKQAVDHVEPTVKWSYDDSVFDNIIIRFTVLSQEPVKIGSKLTNRYGGKGVVSLVLPDDEMPIDENGNRIEICANPLGVINRMNLSQLYELEINFIMDQTILKMKEMDKPDKQLSLLMSVVGDINPTQADDIRRFLATSSPDDREAFIKEVVDSGKFPIHQPPFFDNLEFESLVDIYDKYDIKPLKFDGIEEPLICSDMYWLKLKHTPESKLSARSASTVSIKNIPHRNNSELKQNRLAYSNTPIRMGEMEFVNMLITNQSDAVFNLLRSHSSNSVDRAALIDEILTAPDPTSEIDFIPDGVNESGLNLEAYLTSMGVKIVKNEDYVPISDDDFVTE